MFEIYYLSPLWNNAQLKEHLYNGDDWEKMETPLPGVFVIKVPATKSRPSLLYVETNPLNKNRRLMKKKGLFINTSKMLRKYNELLSASDTIQLVDIIDQINKIILTTHNEF